MIEFAALIIGTLTTFLIALTVFTKNKRSITNQLFVALAVSLIGWSVTTYFSLHTSNDQQTLSWIRWIMFFVVTQNAAFFLLVQVFPDHQSKYVHSRWFKISVLYSALTAAVAISPFLFARFADGAPQPGPGMALFMPHALIFAIGGIVALIIKYQKSQGLMRTQLRYFLAGTLLLFTVEPAGNFIMPIMFGNNSFVSLSPLYAIVFSGLIAYAILTKKLFDIRSAVARSVAYILVTITMVGLYVAGLFGIINVFFGGAEKETLRQFLSILILMPLAISFQYLKSFFDRITRQLFYRENYNFQEVLDKIGNVVATETNLNKVLNGTRDTLSGALNASFLEYVLVRDGKPFFLPGRHLESHAVSLAEHLSEQQRVLIVMEEIDTQNALWQPFQDAQVALSLRLRTQKEIIGYILIGYKKNGEAYSLQDRQLLTIAAGELAIAVQNAQHFEEIQQFNQTLQQRVDDATRKLRASNEKLKKLDETKDEFVSMASHQLRTPLTSVKGYLSMVLEGDGGDLNDTQRQMLTQSFTSAQRMVYLISDLLNLSRLNTGKFVIDAGPVDLRDVVAAELEQLSEMAKVRGIQLTYEPPKTFPTLMLDETKVHQVVMNFVDNSIYYTPAGGKIVLSLHETATAVEFHVQDSGIGVPREVQRHLFTKFYRADNARRMRPDGTGLGLFMAKKVTVAQGGAVLFESEEGKGSTFGFRFSKASHMVTPDQAKETSPKT